MADENNNDTPKKISQSERTHARISDNLHIANEIAASLGAIFNPTNVNLISLASLTAFEATTESLMGAVNDALTIEQTKVGAQIAAFKLVSARVTKIMKAAAAQGLSAEFMQSLRSTANRLNGVRVDKKTPDNSGGNTATEPAGSASVSRRSYAGILESLDLLEAQLGANADYAPNEEEYQISAISVWIKSLRDLHDEAIAAKIATSSARNARNSFVYNESTGIVPRMNALKAYAETILDKNDPRLKQLKKLKFGNYTK